MRIKAAFVVIGFLLVGALFTLCLGQDANFDLKNYHLYNAYAYLTNRLGHDLYPAALQTLLNPLLDVLYFKTVLLFDDPLIVTFLMGLWFGFFGWGIYRCLRLLQPQPSVITALAGAVFGISSAAAVGQAGTTTNEVNTSALMMMSFVLWIYAVQKNNLAHIRISGLIAGIATGLKLTAASYSAALGIALVVLTLIDSQRYPRKLVIHFALLGFAGLLLSAGQWHYFLWQRYESPIFPYYNDFFKSPHYEPISLYVSAWRATTWERLFVYPFEISFINRHPREEYYSDPRLMIGFVASFILLAFSAVTLIKNRFSFNHPFFKNGNILLSIALPVAWLAGYFLWAYMHGNYRYSVALEAWSALVLMALLYQLHLPKRVITCAMVVIAITSIYATTYLSWGRVNYGLHTYDVRPPEIHKNALVILLPDKPMSYVIPFFPPETRFVSPKANWSTPTLKNKVQLEMNTAIETWQGPLYGITRNDYNFAEDDVLKYFALDVARNGEHGCRPIPSNIEIYYSLQICELKRR